VVLGAEHRVPAHKERLRKELVLRVPARKERVRKEPPLKAPARRDRKATDRVPVDPVAA
jgi:hypothetical protein